MSWETLNFIIDFLLYILGATKRSHITFLIWSNNIAVTAIANKNPNMCTKHNTPSQSLYMLTTDVLK